ncbi:phosphatase PAP2/dual specificity phosphatase family protein [Thaumasiovibrio subtropicus]|uniref:phosphatase PAP2/dual specificity phosphatase family protein n=1 Tax=Thaumasiovibrio subtropicus TaxID=1891207 RepID=UPI00192CF2B4|nr:phosphatase PAP2/dual specificity phosphatase family protein [Thaumasiovibrio subtropicus]
MKTSDTQQAGLAKLGIFWLLFLSPLFSFTYLFALHHTALNPAVPSIVFEWESHIPFWSWSIVPYWSINLLYLGAFFVPRSRHEIHRLGVRLLTTQLICIAIFLIYPLQFSWQRPETSGLFGALFSLLNTFDQPFNQAPSLHIALLVVLWVTYLRGAPLVWRWIIHTWFILIGISVLTTWQHHFIDVPTGALVGLVVVWMWPLNNDRQHRPHPVSATLWPFALAYGLSSLMLLVIAIKHGGVVLWLIWPAVSFGIVALCYMKLGGAGLQKGINGQFSAVGKWLLAPYLVGARLNANFWQWRWKATRVHPDLVLSGLPSSYRDAEDLAIVDMTAELSGPKKAAAYLNMPLLDMEVPSPEQCFLVITAMQAMPKPIHVCCALGCTRSATIAVAWLLYTRQCPSVEVAIGLLARRRPQVVLKAAHRQTLAVFHANYC